MYKDLSMLVPLTLGGYSINLTVLPVINLLSFNFTLFFKKLLIYSGVFPTNIIFPELILVSVISFPPVESYKTILIPLLELIALISTYLIS